MGTGRTDAGPVDVDPINVGPTDVDDRPRKGDIITTGI